MKIFVLGTLWLLLAPYIVCVCVFFMIFQLILWLLKVFIKYLRIISLLEQKYCGKSVMQLAKRMYSSSVANTYII
jgi:hypothetical protein